MPDKMPYSGIVEGSSPIPSTGQRVLRHAAVINATVEQVWQALIPCNYSALVKVSLMELPITHRGVVYPWQCDHMGHMNVMWYVGKFDEATWGLFTLLGVTPAYVREHQRGMAAVDQRITYKRELVAGDVIYIRSGVLEIREKVIRFFHEMRNEETGEVAAATMLTGVHIDTQTRKSCPFPKAVVERGQALITDYNLDA